MYFGLVGQTAGAGRRGRFSRAGRKALDTRHREVAGPVAGNHGAGLFIWSNSSTAGLSLWDRDHILSEQLVSKQVGRAVRKPAQMMMWSGRGQGCVSPCTNRSCMKVSSSAVSGRPEVTTPSQAPTRPLRGLETPLPMDCPEFWLL